MPHDGKRLRGPPLRRRAIVLRPKSRATATPPAPAIAGTTDWLGVRSRMDGDLAQARRRLATLGGGDDEVRVLLEPVRAALDDLGAAIPALVARADAFAEAVAGAADREELKALGRELASEERLLRLSVKDQLLGNRVRQEAAPVPGRTRAKPEDQSDGTPDVLRAVYRELLLGINAERRAAGLDSIEPVQIAPPASPASTVRRCTPGPAVACHVRAGEASARLLADHGSTLRRFHRRLRHPPWRGSARRVLPIALVSLGLVGLPAGQLLGIMTIGVLGWVGAIAGAAAPADRMLDWLRRDRCHRRYRGSLLRAAAELQHGLFLLRLGEALSAPARDPRAPRRILWAGS